MNWRQKEVEYRWHASGNRWLRPRDMTDEHLINTLNWVERNFPDSDTAPNNEQATQGYRHLRLEAIRRGIRWRGFASQKPLEDGDINLRFRSDSQPQPRDDGKIALGQIKIGQQFKSCGHLYYKINPIGVLATGLERQGYCKMADPTHISHDTDGILRCCVMNTRTGAAYLKASYERVEPVEASVVDLQFPPVGEFFDHRC